MDILKGTSLRRVQDTFPFSSSFLPLSLKQARLLGVTLEAGLLHISVSLCQDCNRASSTILTLFWNIQCTRLFRFEQQIAADNLVDAIESAISERLT